jgi:hypothetical protein
LGLFKLTPKEDQGSPMKNSRPFSDLEQQAHENRTEKRLDTALSIVFSTLQTRNDSPEIEARTRNLSTSGMCFVSCKQLRPKLILFIRSIDAGDDEPYPGASLKSSVLGEVRWCRKVRFPNSECYHIGVSYF